MSDLIERQAAIDALEKVADLFPWRVPGKSDTYDSYNEAWNDAIGRAEMEIEKLPSVQPVDKDINVSCKDAISRQKAINYCYQLINVEHLQGSDEMNYGQVRVDQTETILHHLEFMPSVHPTYTDAEVQKIQELEQAQLDKAFSLGREDAKPQWIPVVKRLPEVGTYVLVSKKALGFKSNLPNVCTAHRLRDPRSGKEEWNDMLFGKLDDDRVLAWMPLPEPFREEGENE